MLKTKVALAGFEPRSPAWQARILPLNHQCLWTAQSYIKYCIHVKNKDCIGGESNPGLPRGRREFTTEPPMLVTSTICPAQSYIKYCIHVKNKDCIGGESNPGLPRGRREFYHWTTNACNVVNFPCTITYKILHSCKKQRLHWRGIEPRSPAWQARILPLNHQCL